MMKPFVKHQTSRGTAAFTMIEIAISLAVIAFALVAIIGVMPSGMQVQRDNREETIINQEALLLSSAIRNGARGMNDLTNYVFAITNFFAEFELTPTSTNFVRANFDGYDAFSSDIHSFAPAPPNFILWNGLRIVGLLGRSKYEPIVGGFRSNYVVAYVHALSGLASQKVPQTNADVALGSFTYRVLVENMQSPRYDDGKATGGDPYGKQLTNNLRDLRLTFRWPLSPRNNEPGNGRYTFRTTVPGHPVTIDDPDATPAHKLFFFEPQSFVTQFP